MHRITNLSWPETPYGAGQRPFGKAVPMLAAANLGWTDYWATMCPKWTCFVYLRTDSTRTLSLDECALNFGFDLHIQEFSNENLAYQFDKGLVAARRAAKILAAHNFGEELSWFDGLAEHGRMPGVDSVRQQWSDRAHKGRGMAAMFDTAYDPEAARDFDDTCARLNITGLGQHDEGRELEPDYPTLVARWAIKETLTVALIAAACTSKYRWSGEVDVEQAVTAAAWDRLATFDEQFATVTSP